MSFENYIIMFKIRIKENIIMFKIRIKEYIMMLKIIFAKIRNDA